MASSYENLWRVITVQALSIRTWVDSPVSLTPIGECGHRQIMIALAAALLIVFSDLLLIALIRL